MKLVGDGTLPGLLGALPQSDSLLAQIVSVFQACLPDEGGLWHYTTPQPCGSWQE